MHWLTPTEALLILIAIVREQSVFDLVNGVYESCGGFFVALSVAKLHKEKLVRGVSWYGIAFFSSWGIWNLFFYPHLGQWMSFGGGVALCAVNCVWLGQVIFYNWRERCKSN